MAKDFTAADKGKGMKRGGKMVRPTAPKLPKALAKQSMPLPNDMAGPAAGPAAPPPPSGMGMKKGGFVAKMSKPVPGEKDKRWAGGESKDKEGKKVAMKSGGRVKKFASGGAVTRGDGIAQRGHTRGTQH